MKAHGLGPQRHSDAPKAPAEQVEAEAPRRAPQVQERGAASTTTAATASTIGIAAAAAASTTTCGAAEAPARGLVELLVAKQRKANT